MHPNLAHLLLTIICIYGYCCYCIYILSLFDIYIYMGLTYMYCHCRYLIYICFWYIYMYCHCSSQLHLPGGSVVVWTKSRVRYIHIATICLLNSACRQGVSLWGQSRYLIRVYVSDICIHWAHIATTCLINFACRQGVCACGQSRYLIRIFVSDIYVLSLFVYSTLLAYWECNGVDEVACSIYTYFCRCCL